MINKEKYDLLVKLLKEGRTNREICKIVRCSPNEITLIRKKIFGENTDTGIDMKGKSLCAQIFNLLEKGTSLTQIVIQTDADPEEAMQKQDKYLLVSKRDKIIRFLSGQNDLDLCIEILEFLIANPEHWQKIKKSKDLETVIQDRKDYLMEIEEEIETKKIINKHYDRQLQTKEKKLGLPNKY
jgi:hypothetical protein